MTSVPYGTSNVYLASFLLCQGAVLLGFERPSRRRFVYRFSADEKLHELLRLYWSATPINLVPDALFGSLRRLKSLVRGSPVQAVPASSSPVTPLPVPPACPAESIEPKNPDDTSSDSTLPPSGTGAGTFFPHSPCSV
jgi:hypothetical protein